MCELLLQADRLLTVDLVDRADALYRQVADRDPRNADAVIGMARCALARGDDHEAYRLAARARAIDPGHDMARRMEARMAEVLRTRSEEPGTGAPLTARPGAPPGAAVSRDADGVASSPAARAPSAVPAAGPATNPRRTLVERLRGR